MTNNRSLAAVGFVVNMRTALLRQPPVSQEQLNRLILTHKSPLSVRLCRWADHKAPVSQCGNPEWY